MRAAPVLLLVALAGIVHAQEARFDVLLKGKKAGVATYRLSERNGGRVTRLRIALADGSVTESLSISDATGAAVMAENNVRRGTSRTKETISYNAKGDATIVTNGKKPLLVPFHARGTRKDPSELWFRSLKPSPSTWAIYLALEPRKRVWEQVKVTYVGKKGAGNLIRQERGGLTTNFTVDDKGVPLMIESGDLRMVRH